ncbi:MAG TPA: hypothetical protein VLM44_01345 [Lutibacter sp.]|nr:hypothetical protein [Lutibacter sp.]
MKKILRYTIDAVQQKKTQIAIIALLVFFTMLSSFYLMYTVFSNI